MKNTKDILVSEYLERVGGDVLASEHFRTIVRGMIKGHAGTSCGLAQMTPMLAPLTSGLALAACLANTHFGY